MSFSECFWTEYPRDVVQVAGADALAYLQSQLSQDLRSLQVGQSVWSFVLQPTGKVDVLLRVWRRADDTFVLDTDASFGEVLTARLNRFKIRVKAEITPLDWKCIAIRGAGAPQVDGLASWGNGVDLLGPEVRPPAGIEHGDPEQLLSARVSAVWPQMGAEIVPGETIPAETGITQAAVSFTKGCYPGQEPIARLHYRGHANRGLRVLTLAELPAPEDELSYEGKNVGRITSAAPTGDGAVALAYVRREVPEDAELAVRPPASDAATLAVAALPNPRRP